MLSGSDVTLRLSRPTRPPHPLRLLLPQMTLDTGAQTNWISMAAGGSHTVALKSDGTLWAWGDNSFGQLGDGTTISKSSPVQTTPYTYSIYSSTGNNVTVTLPGAETAITFSSVSSPGYTTVTLSNTGPALLAGFNLGNPLTFYDISTTAAYIPPVTVCITYDPAQYGNPAAAQLLHYENSAWVNITTSNDLDNHIICGQTNTLSPFVIVEPTTYTVTASVAGDPAGGSVSPPSQTVSYGATATFTVTTNTGYTAAVS
jgi:hypothetical protein